jgi:Na+(H+)/acetate symporter ActP
LRRAHIKITSTHIGAINMQFHGTFTTDTEAQAILARAADFTGATQTLIILISAVALAAILASYLAR